MPNNLSIVNGALMPRLSFLGRLREALHPRNVTRQMLMNTMHDARFRVAQQRNDLVFLLEIIKECEARGIDTTLIKKADALMCEAHKGVKRDSDEPYHFHPRAVAMILIKEFGVEDVDMICAALLHDVVEDNRSISKEFITKEFNKDVADLVDGVTKLDKSLGKARGRENLKKLIAASAADPRVAILKLADNLHNIRTIGAVAEERTREKAEEIARETLRVYAPLAQILAVRDIRDKLEEAAYDFLDPEGMAAIRDMIERKKKTIVGKQEKTTLQAAKDAQWQYREVITERFQEFGLIKSDVEIRTELKERSPAELYRMKERFEGQGRTIAETTLLSDLYKVILIVDIKEKDDPGITDEKASSLACAMAHQIVVQMNSQLENRYHDFIIRPRADGYKGIDDTIDFGRYGSLRVSFVTPEMKSWYERGILSVDYRDSNAAQVLLRKAARILKGKLLTEADIADLLSGSVFEIKILTEEGNSIGVPQGSTARDFAYYVHTSVGHEADSAIVNGQKQPLDFLLQNGDSVTIQTDEDSVVTPDALRQVRTPHAKKQILRYLRGAKRTNEETLAAGETSLIEAAQEKFLTIDDILQSPLATTIFRRILPEIDHNTSKLRAFRNQVSRLEVAGRVPTGKALAINEMNGLRNYFMLVVGTGAIDSRRIVEEYVKIQNIFNSVISNLIELAGEMRLETAQSEQTVFVPSESVVARYQDLAEKVKSELGIEELNAIKDSSWYSVLGRKANGMATAIPKIAGIIAKFITFFKADSQINIPMLFTSFASPIEKIQPRRIMITLKRQNYMGLSAKIFERLKRLGLDVPKYTAKGEGDEPAEIEIQITPETYLQRQQIINIVADFVDESGEIEVVELQEDQLS